MSRRRKFKDRRPSTAGDHRCELCRAFGGFVQVTDVKGRPAFAPCPNGKPPAQAAPTELDHAQRAAGEKQEA